MTKNKSLQEMTQDVQKSIKMYPNVGTKPWDYQIAAKDIAVQAGSLIKLIMQLNNERYGHGKSESMLKAAISDELADILSLVLYVADELDIDINEAWENMLESDNNKVTERLPKAVV